jgi:hypothetical protein
MWLTPEVREQLIYWKNPRDSGIAFGSVFVILLATKYVSIISVVANLALALITSTMAFRIYKSVISAVNKSSDGHPFKQYMNVDVNLPVDQVRELVLCVVKQVNIVLARAKSAIMVEEWLESLKFFACMYGLTYIGKMFNGLTIVLTVWVIIFTAPRVYRDNQAKIDEALKPIKEKLNELTSKVKSSVPAAKKEE